MRALAPSLSACTCFKKPFLGPRTFALAFRKPTPRSMALSILAWSSLVRGVTGTNFGCSTFPSWLKPAPERDKSRVRARKWSGIRSRVGAGFMADGSLDPEQAHLAVEKRTQYCTVSPVQEH